MKKVRFGVLGTALIGREIVIPAMQKGKYTEVVGIASRTKERAQDIADELGIPKAYGSYEALLKAKDIDAVYIPLPNHMHVEWTIKAMNAGKHVLCEKPMGLNDEEVNKVINATTMNPDVRIMEAFMYRHHPQWVEAKRLVETGEIGDLVTIQTFFSFHNDDPDDIRNKPETGGGALMDIGCYAVSLSRFIFNAQPRRVIAFEDRDPNFGIDRVFSGMMDFNGRIATFTCSTQLADYQRVNILGTTGRIEILIPFTPQPGAPTQIRVQRDNAADQDDRIRTITFGVADQYMLQGDIFAKAIIDGVQTPATIMDAWDNMHVIDALFKSAETGNWQGC